MKKQKQYLRSVRDKILKRPEKRSSHWPKVERDFKSKNPVCAACGSKKKLNVHHVKPFHLYPQLELDENNLITLCMDRNECHIKLGHGGDWKAYNPNVRKDVDKVHNDVKLLNEMAEHAKQEKLYE